ncbi:carbohydrate ABC transporter permease [Cohnella nanjingensis]|uniref:Carbohydrate ABC transporter permease n=1 Tax=Cohnella nanjingensis TaxID=1387779 RepID=A0A7X0RN89_9BACL|nr:carbohydrate ABC transporter permease [Cohnella nanjingensis]MBB6670649.1 carbohydrate ABC transporter permease [Cohnella nanjingensis]
MSIAWPKDWNFVDNYSEVFRIGRISTAFWNSILITGSSVILLIVLCSTSAFVIQRRNSKFTKLLQVLLLGGMILPLSIIITYILLYNLHLTGSFLAVILLYVATMYPVIAFLYIGFYNGVSREIDEAAIIDGTKGYGLFFRVIFPLLKPINATALVLGFVTVWNDFGLALYFLNQASKYTLGLTVFFFAGEKSSQWNLIFADLIVVSIPVIIVYIFAQRFIVSGLTAGAVKS